MLRRFAFVLCVLLVAATTLHAQDQRTVTEPRVPAACTTLKAQLVASGRSLAAEDEQKLDTERIQKAMDHCGQGQAVVLEAAGARNAFLSGPLELRTGVTLVIARGATLFASRDAALYATGPNTCGLVLEKNLHGCRPLIRVDHANNAGVMGEGTIDGRGGEKLLGRDVSWWDLAEQARAGGSQQAFRLVVADNSDNLTLYGTTYKNSPNFHITYSHGTGFTAWAVKIDTPKRLARNTDGIDPGNGARNVTIAHCSIRTGDDNVAIKGGVGAIRVENLTLDGPDNGIRIKSNGSRGGLTGDVMYTHVCIRNSPNPIMLDTAYTANGALRGEKKPTMRGIVLRDVRVAGGGKITFNGYDAEHRIAAQLDGVQLTDEAAYKYVLTHSDLTLGPEATNLQLPAGDDATVKGKATTAKTASCDAQFVPLGD